VPRPPAQRPAPTATAAAPPPESPWFPPQDWSEERAPEDFRIGALETGGGDAMARRVLEAFFGALTSGSVDAPALDPTRREALAGLLEAQLQKAGRPTAWRIGRLEPVADGELRARIRLFVERGSIDGEAYLVKAPEGWLVSDFQVDLTAARAGRGGEQFLPSPYRDRTE
jgi:hypothetical protein